MISAMVKQSCKFAKWLSWAHDSQLVRLCRDDATARKVVMSLLVGAR